MNFPLYTLLNMCAVFTSASGTYSISVSNGVTDTEDGSCKPMRMKLYNSIMIEIFAFTI